MHWLEAFHVISVVCWFAGLFYLPRLYVYHTQADDRISIERFKVMEHKLYYYITYPAGILTIIFGCAMLFWHHSMYEHMMWMHVKLFLVFILVLYHLYLGKLLKDFKNDNNQHPEKFYRWINEVPTVVLIVVVILVYVKP